MVFSICDVVLINKQVFCLMIFFFFILDEGIDKETFLSLEESGNISDLIPKIGPRVKFRKRLREYLQVIMVLLYFTVFFQHSLFKLQERELLY